eukprot:CAMPEP_0202050550 /NCGR_PEP_ID=MMETSP0963-20130614/4078_1 /ASSEMBLY_ACC=CAM_ASM_000494 /TAXON_ID=4773 /ORGANISM="Schizochytrium aggregatum, Strain ATCC28209" /LENGTH=89 /DNA_ID=CAMNT_0048615651 /DNA_START=289 /DNA_END=558 /DNA_ORIENTATION=-
MVILTCPIGCGSEHSMTRPITMRPPQLPQLLRHPGLLAQVLEHWLLVWHARDEPTELELPLHSDRRGKLDAVIQGCAIQQKCHRVGASR